MAEMGEVAIEATESILEEFESSGQPAWSEKAALLTMMMGLLSAIGTLFAGMSSNEALLTRTQETIEQNRAQSARLELAVLDAEREIQESLGREFDTEHAERVRQRRAELDAEIERINMFKRDTSRALEDDDTFSLSVTLLAVAISLSGMAMIARKKYIWHVGLILGGLGTLIFCFGIARYFLR